MSGQELRILLLIQPIQTYSILRVGSVTEMLLPTWEEVLEHLSIKALMEEKIGLK